MMLSWILTGLTVCLSGPGSSSPCPLLLVCVYDLDVDGDVDLADYARLQCNPGTAAARLAFADPCKVTILRSWHAPLTIYIDEQQAHQLSRALLAGPGNRDPAYLLIGQDPSGARRIIVNSWYCTSGIMIDAAPGPIGHGVIAGPPAPPPPAAPRSQDGDTNEQPIVHDERRGVAG